MPFLSAEWKNLILANYEVDPKILQSYLPYKTELDLWNGKCYVSLVGFMFKNTKVMGLKVPFHVNFEEVNLRFYVKHEAKDELKRGVVFIKEIVPKPAITFIANSLYKENYTTKPMRHFWNINEGNLNIHYGWKNNSKWNHLEVEANPQSLTMIEGSEEEFIAEHYWGYTKINDKRTSEYQVEHPKWNVHPVNSFEVKVDIASVYGKQFEECLSLSPCSVFLADGSDISVNNKRYL